MTNKDWLKSLDNETLANFNIISDIVDFNVEKIQLKLLVKQRRKIMKEIEVTIIHNYHIRLDTQRDAVEFSRIAETFPGKVLVKDDDGHCVNAKSVLGMLYALEFDSLHVEAENDIYTKIQKFIVGEST